MFWSVLQLGWIGSGGKLLLWLLKLVKCCLGLYFLCGLLETTATQLKDISLIPHKILYLSLFLNGFSPNLYSLRLHIRKEYQLGNSNFKLVSNNITTIYICKWNQLAIFISRIYYTFNYKEYFICLAYFYCIWWAIT